ncbi:YjaG family protein [Marinobacter daepoensis]|uniref:YjaG family protein n=1 Tax=Marinobacter daepoensis TaxID=262077 RepID=A0ABS3BJ44_9GAMM|nr:YjaG family protein [Marinobacter daepoensis]MBN7771704.1 YjaG family protein [Marinobacter daepoensis]MBY6080882.1 YjaG family protein [Marinobacter daepoensis]
MNANQFLKAVSQLQGWRECAFLLSLAERSFPNYALFADAVGLKTGGKMRQLLDLAWDLLQKDVADAAIPQLLSKLESLCPTVDEYDAYGVYPAVDFCELLEQALLNRLNPNKHRASEASQLATRTVMDFVEMSDGEGLDEHELVSVFEHHPLLKDDKQFQRDTVLALKKQRSPTEIFLAELQAGAANGGVSNLGISLEG